MRGGGIAEVEPTLAIDQFGHADERAQRGGAKPRMDRAPIGAPEHDPDQLGLGDAEADVDLGVADQPVDLRILGRGSGLQHDLEPIERLARDVEHEEVDAGIMVVEIAGRHAEFARQAAHRDMFQRFGGEDMFSDLAQILDDIAPMIIGAGRRRFGCVLRSRHAAGSSRGAIR